jgi:hypothetical protein
VLRAFGLVLLSAAALVASSPTQAVPAATKGVLVGFAFVDVKVTAQGSRAKLPTGTRIFPPGSRITGRTACPRRFAGGTPLDGLLVLVLDYSGPPAAGSATLTFTPQGSGRASFPDAPYNFDVDRGRTLQYLGPRTQNGSYKVEIQLFGAAPQRLAGKLVLARGC